MIIPKKQKPKKIPIRYRTCMKISSRVEWLDRRYMRDKRCAIIS